jgi:hypothetical protein
MIATVKSNAVQGVERAAVAYSSPSFQLNQFRRGDYTL